MIYLKVCQCARRADNVMRARIYAVCIPIYKDIICERARAIQLLVDAVAYMYIYTHSDVTISRSTLAADTLILISERVARSRLFERK